MAGPISKTYFVEVSGDEDSSDESCITDESMCGRWEKTGKELTEKDLPCVNTAHLGLDVDEGREVVWNEVQLSEDHRHIQQSKLSEVLDSLKAIHHDNIIKLHHYWTRRLLGRSTMIFITEHPSWYSIKRILDLLKVNNKTVQLETWKRWCKQILQGLSNLHENCPPIIHGNLCLSTIFSRPDGIVKLRSVGSDALHMALSGQHEGTRNPLCVAPEYNDKSAVTVQADIYSFGVCALEMAAGGLQASGQLMNREVIKTTLLGLKHGGQRGIIQLCLHRDPVQRPSARQLLHHLKEFPDNLT